MSLGSLNAVVEQAKEHGGVFFEVHHELLLLLHVQPESILANGVCVVQEQITF